MVMTGRCREIAPNERLVHTEETRTGPAARCWCPLAESAGVTRATQTVRYSSREAVLRTGMADAMSRSSERLDEVPLDKPRGTSRLICLRPDTP